VADNLTDDEKGPFQEGDYEALVPACVRQAYDDFAMKLTRTYLYRKNPRSDIEAVIKEAVTWTPYVGDAFEEDADVFGVQAANSDININWEIAQAIKKIEATLGPLTDADKEDVKRDMYAIFKASDKPDDK